MTRYLGSAGALRRESTRTDTGSAGALIRLLATAGAYSDTIDVLGTVPIATLTVTDSLAIAEPALSVATVPISGLTVIDSLSIAEPALTAPNVPITGLTVTDSFSGGGAFSDTIDVFATIPINGLIVQDAFSGGIDTHDGDGYAKWWLDRRKKRKPEQEENLAEPLSILPPHPEEEVERGPIPASLVSALLPAPLPVPSGVRKTTPAPAPVPAPVIKLNEDDDGDLEDLMELL